MARRFTCLPMSQEKQCTCCLRFLPLSDFNKNRTKKDGRQYECKQCEKERKRKWREANHERDKERKRKYYEANREKVKERDHKYYEANSEKLKERRRKYREANPEKEKERYRKYHEEKRATNTQQAVLRGIDPNKLKELKNKLKELDK